MVCAVRAIAGYYLAGVLFDGPPWEWAVCFGDHEIFDSNDSPS